MFIEQDQAHSVYYNEVIEVFKILKPTYRQKTRGTLVKYNILKVR